MGAVEQLVRDAASLKVTLSDTDARRLLALLDELARWNEMFNLTGICLLYTSDVYKRQVWRRA